MPPEAEREILESDFVLTVIPNPAVAGTVAGLVVGIADTAPEGMAQAIGGEIAVGADAWLQCWNGAGWVDTHHLLAGGGSVHLLPGVTVTTPPVALSPEDQPFPILVPEVPAGIYRIKDVLNVSGVSRPVYRLLEVEDAS